MKDLAILFKRDLERLSDEIKQYPNDESLWSLEDGINNSGGNLCLHLCGNLRHFIGKNIGEDGYVRNREREFTAKGLTKDELLLEIEEAKKVVSEIVAQLNDEALASSYPENVPIPDTTVRHVLIHLYAHLSYHLGQINYHRRLLT